MMSGLFTNSFKRKIIVSFLVGVVGVYMSLMIVSFKFLGQFSFIGTAGVEDLIGVIVFLLIGGIAGASNCFIIFICMNLAGRRGENKLLGKFTLISAVITLSVCYLLAYKWYQFVTIT